MPVTKKPRVGKPALFDREHEPPQDGESPVDGPYKIAKAMASLVPGGSALFSMLLSEPLTRRRDEWFHELAAAVRELQAQKRIDVSALGTDPAFLDAFMTATHAALRTSQVKKRAALRNALLNVALRTGPEEAVRAIFFTLVDRVTDLHLALVDVFQNASAFRRADGSSLPERSRAIDVLHDAFPESAQKHDLYSLVWQDLYSMGLVALPKIDNGLEGDARRIKRTTALGDAFVTFIRAPDGLENGD